MILQYRLYDLSDKQTSELERNFDTTQKNQTEPRNAYKFFKEAKKSKEGKYSVEIEWEIDDKQLAYKQKEAYAQLMELIKPIMGNKQKTGSGESLHSL